jgi:hypothetical protein
MPKRRPIRKSENIGVFSGSRGGEGYRCGGRALARLQTLPLIGRTRELVADMADFNLAAGFQKASDAVNALLGREKAQ